MKCPTSLCRYTPHARAQGPEHGFLGRPFSHIRYIFGSNKPLFIVKGVIPEFAGNSGIEFRQGWGWRLQQTRRPTGS